MILQRIKNLWKLSEYRPGEPKEEYTIPGTKVSMIVKEPQKAQSAKFVPFQKIDPIKELVNEQPQ